LYNLTGQLLDPERVLRPAHLQCPSHHTSLPPPPPSPASSPAQHVIAEEIAVAFGRRHVYKLVDVLSLPKAAGPRPCTGARS